MPVKKLFYENAYTDMFYATVLSCAECENGFLIELDQTCFYPEGGGQPADTGTLDGAVITDVHERGGVILHTADRPLEVGSTVEGRIDWLRRFSLMQHHTGEHIVSGIAHRLYKLDNVGFHMGGAMTTVDLSGELTSEDIDKIELLANRAVFANLPVDISCPPPDELATLDYRSKKALTGEVRIVSIPNTDRCACCGTHVARTGEIGLIKLLAPQHYKGGMRIGILCGERALLDYRRKDADTAAIARMFSAKQQEVVAAVERACAEAERLRQQLSSAGDRLFSALADAADTSDAPLCLFEDDLSPNELRRFCTVLTARRAGPCAVLSGNNEAGYKYALGVNGGDARALSKAMHQALGGRGGGSAQLVQGVITSDRTAIEAYFKEI